MADANARVVHQFAAVRDGGCSQERTVAFGAPLGAVTVDGLTIATTAL